MKKKPLGVSVAAFLLLGIILSGCGKSTASDAVTTSFEAQHKTETEVENINDGFFPQIFEKSVTYIQKEQDGKWEIEESKTTKWSLGDTSDLADSSWMIEVPDTAALDPGLSGYKGIPATVYLHFGSDMGEITAAWTETLHRSTCDLICASGIERSGLRLILESR